MKDLQALAPGKAGGSSGKAWLRALELTAPIVRNRERVLSNVVNQLADKVGGRVAFLSDRESLTYRNLAERSNRYARWALDQGLAKGDVVGLLMTNRPEYFAIWLGITSVGCVVSLLNTNLNGPSLAHCINVASVKHLIATAEFIEAATSALPHLNLTVTVWTHGPNVTSYRRIDSVVDKFSGDALSAAESRPPTIEDRALYIYTSGTTGLPKAASVSHARIMQWSHWFSGMMDVRSSDRMYNCLPLYHSVGGVVVPGSTLVGGGTVVIRERFSASQFWTDIARWDCTLFQYIGELCRYLLNAPASEHDRNHRIRMACGNGLAPEVWEPFQKRFGIPRIFEFYGATEGAVSLFNIEGKPGAIGHIPPYLAHRFSPTLVQFDVEKGELFRNEHGFCVACERNQVGEAIAKITNDPSNVGSRFEGYTDREASEQRILRDVFNPGDSWFRTGDLMRKDERGFFYFVDRVGDTFRWKGENVATSEISGALCAFPGVHHANVYGVSIPSAEGKAGMAALMVEDHLDLAGLREHLVKRLPHYARPLFLRIRKDADVTVTFKYSKTELARQGYDPAASTDALYFNDPELRAFSRLDKVLYDRILEGRIRL